jgi:hypothetical protein
MLLKVKRMTLRGKGVVLLVSDGRHRTEAFSDASGRVENSSKRLEVRVHDGNGEGQRCDRVHTLQGQGTPPRHSPVALLQLQLLQKGNLL